MALNPPPIRTEVLGDDGLLTYPWQRYMNDEYNAILDATGGTGDGSQGVTGLKGSQGVTGFAGSAGGQGLQGVTGLSGSGGNASEADTLAYSWVMT